MEQRLPHCRRDTARDSDTPARDPAGVESQQGGGRDGEKERRTRRRAENKGRAVPTHRLFRLLRSRNDRHAVGEHIFR